MQVVQVNRNLKKSLNVVKTFKQAQSRNGRIDIPA